MLPLSVVIMLGLMYTGIMMDTAIQEAPRSYYVRRQMPVAEPAEPAEPDVDAPPLTLSREWIYPPNIQEPRAIFLFHHAYSHTGITYASFIHNILDQVVMYASEPIYFITNMEFEHFGVQVLPEVDIDWNPVFQTDSGPWNTGFTRFMNVEYYMNERNITQAIQIETDNIILKPIHFSWFNDRYNTTIAMTPLGKNMFTGSVSWIGSLKSLKQMNRWMIDIWSTASNRKRKQLVGDVGYSPRTLESSSEMLALGAYSRAGQLAMFPTFGSDLIFDPGTYGQLFVTKLKPQILPHHWVTSRINTSFDVIMESLFNLHHYQPKQNIPKFIRDMETIDLGIICSPKHTPALRTLIGSVPDQTRMPDNIIISMYGMPSIQCDRCIYLNQSNPMNAAENRNAIIKKSTSTFITFMDCDDTMHSRRTEIMFEAMSSQDIGWHSYSSTSPNIPQMPQSIYNLGIKDNMIDANNIPVAHGHVTIRRGSTLYLREDSKYRRGQDTKFARDMIQAGARSVFVNAKLIQYTPSASRQKNIPLGLKEFENPFSGGGMSEQEQEFLLQTYQSAASVFEWGMGSSSSLANYAGVNELVSVDSVQSWVENTKKVVQNERYKFTHVDIGQVGAWGTPTGPKILKWLDYSNKVNDESKSFDVYLVDGRFRVACACMALLHGRDDSYVMIHDFERDYYQEILHVAEKMHQVGKLVKIKKKHNVEEQINNMWEKNKYDYR